MPVKDCCVKTRQATLGEVSMNYKLKFSGEFKEWLDEQLKQVKE